MNLTKEDIRKLKQACERFSSTLEEVEKPTVEEGQYWERNGEIKRIEGIDDACKLPISYNIVTGTDEEGGSCTRVYLLKHCPHNLLSDDEVEQALKEEAIRRGLREVGTRYKDASDGHIETIGHDYSLSVQFGYVSSSFHPDGLTDGCGGWIYYNGDWAEILDDEWEVSYTHTQYILEKGNKSFKLDALMSREQAEAIAKALNDL